MIGPGSDKKSKNEKQRQKTKSHLYCCPPCRPAPTPALQEVLHGVRQQCSSLLLPLHSSTGTSTLSSLHRHRHPAPTHTWPPSRALRRPHPLSDNIDLVLDGGDNPHEIGANSPAPNLSKARSWSCSPHLLDLGLHASQLQTCRCLI